MIPIHERRVLEAYVRGMKPNQLMFEQDHELNEYEKRELKELIRMRMQGIPLQYLVHSQEFYGREFYVNTSVLIPRPETEGLVEHALRVLEKRPHTQTRLHALDFGTGSGCIGLTLALERPDLVVWGSEASVEASDVALENARKHRVANYDILHCSDPPMLVQYDHLPSFDLIVSNPPYLTHEDEIAKDVREYEPPEALFSTHEGDPCYYYSFLAKLCREKLTATGFAALEIAENRSTDARALFEREGFAVQLEKDLTDRPRYLLVRRS